MSVLPVVVVGAGPLGLAAAAHLMERGLDPLVLEAGSRPAAAIEQWDHVRTFSPWPELVDAAAARLLEPTGWTAHAAGFPTGREWIDDYLAPVAEALGPRVRYGARVTAVSRLGRDRLVSPGRAEAPFVVYVDGAESRIRARAVIDASGTWGQPNPAGADGVPAIGERAAAASGVLTYVPPTLPHATALAGKHVVVVGSGHSAMTAVIQLGEVARKDPSTTVTWVLRRGVSEDTFGGGTADELPQRGALGVRSREAVDDGRVALTTGFRTERIDLIVGRAVLSAEDGRSLPPADRVVVLTGFRPDLSFLSEMRIALDPILQAPVNLAGSIDPNLHSCGSVLPHGAAELAHPEPNLYIVGMKSYGRAPTFLAMTGYEQVRSIAAELAGDHEAARRVELTLPVTGVCNGAGLSDGPDGEDAGAGCCGPASSTPRPGSLSLNHFGG
ncbi:NAD(P)-binding domain-containing protein [Mycolicibacterium sediminis]|uniref:Putative secreted protein n=1 Tax=Mycolicibacterium sediminis TaxID=1286180 RepID=A0A7I7QJQ9_9MYCO|nr:NAD(P)-binding domain-containing protein [Mycolicibacterium sediminis]BBY26350.1 putative secreted protein [Mycolicibacterium sediminis]